MWTLSFPARQTEEREKPEPSSPAETLCSLTTERRDLPIAVVSEVMSSEFYQVLRIPLPTKQNKTKNPQLHAEILFRCLDGIRYPIALCETFLLCVPGGKCNCDGRSLERLLSVHAHTCTFALSCGYLLLLFEYWGDILRFILWHHSTCDFRQ